MRKVEAFGSVQNGVLKISYKGQFVDMVRQFPDCRIKLTVEKLYKKRSNEQNAYIHGYLIPEVTKGLIDQGYPPEQINNQVTKTFLKSKFLRHEIYNEVTGEYVETILNTSELTTTQMCEFVDNVIRWAAEDLGIKILLPNEQVEMELT